jgi:hypothetical protein
MSSTGISFQNSSTSSGSGDLVSAPTPPPLPSKIPEIESGPKKRNSNDLIHSHNEKIHLQKKEKLSMPNDIKNKKMLILDFVEQKKENLSLVYKIIRERTPVHPVSLKLLEKGGISVLFRSETAKNIVAKLLYEQLATKLRPKQFMEVKKAFEVSCRLPKDIDAQEVCTSINAFKCIPRLGKEFIFFLNSKEEAKALLCNGFMFKEYLLVFEPFTFAPRLCCLNCGSKDHKQCEEEVKSSSCGYCMENHSFKDCEKLKLDKKAARLTKNKTYAEALLSKNSSAITARNEYHDNLTDSFLKMNLIDQVNFILEKAPKAAECIIDGTEFTIQEKEDYNAKIIKERILMETLEAMELEEARKAAKLASVKHDIKPNTKVKGSNLRVENAKKKKPKKNAEKSKYEPALIAAYEKGNAMQIEPEKKSEEPTVSINTYRKETIGAAYCSCGLLFNVNPGWKNHLKSASKCSMGQKVTCNCGKIVLTLNNWDENFILMKLHLRDGSCSNERRE